MDISECWSWASLSHVPFMYPLTALLLGDLHHTAHKRSGDPGKGATVLLELCPVRPGPHTAVCPAVLRGRLPHVPPLSNAGPSASSLLCTTWPPPDWTLNEWLQVSS